MRSTDRYRRWTSAAVLAVGVGLLAPAGAGALPLEGPRGRGDGGAGAAADEGRRPLLRDRGRALDLVAGAIGVSRAQVVSELREGHSIAEIARNHDTDPKAVIDALVAAATRRIDAAVAADRLDPERAGQLKAKLPERAERLVEREPGRRDARHRPRGLRVAKRAIAVAATTIGIDRSELVEGLRAGRSIAEIARNHDTDPKAVIDALVAAATRRIDAAVAADRLDPERAGQLKAKLPERAERLVEHEPRTRSGRRGS